jgi:hypothetical protein
MFHPMKANEETSLVCSSSPDTLSPDAECELTSMVESLPSSNGIMKPATHPTPSIASITRGAPSTLPAGGKLTADAPAFVPRRAVVIKNTSGEEVDLR